MQQLPKALSALATRPQFILWKTATRAGKITKLPVDYRTGAICDAQDASAWTDATTALSAAAAFGLGVGFVFTIDDPFYFVDIDNCLNADGSGWSDVANDVMSMLPGAAVEVSQSGKGLHIFGQGRALEHGCRNTHLGLEFYTEGRFVALTGSNTVGDAYTDNTAHLPALVAKYFPPTLAQNSAEWSAEPVEAWSGPVDDDELVAKAMASAGAGSIFGNSASFADLWTNNEEKLAGAFPPDNDIDSYNRSVADASLAQHLAFWTGNDCERMLRLMWKSGLVRDKWTDREGYYLNVTIEKAVSLQVDVYSNAPKADPIAEQFGGVKLRATSESHRNYASNIRAEKLAECMGDIEAIEALCKVPSASFWTENKDRPVDEIVESIKKIDTAFAPTLIKAPEIVSGFQYLGATQQIEFFNGCVYIQDVHKILTNDGVLLKPEQFNATFGGYTFQLDDSGAKTTRKAWEAFTESQIVRYPIASSMAFRPLAPEGELIEEDGQVLANAYRPVETKSTPGDVSPFLKHLAILLPNPHDQQILTAYMAAIVQHKGVKFQWAPLLQGAPGNGKTLFSRCLAFAISSKYTHWPISSELGEKYNDWLFNRLLICIEDVYVPDHKKEIIESLKPMITNDRLAKRGMHQGQVMQDNYANFILNTNHKDAIRKDRDDRRFAVFYCAQQTAADIRRDDMGGDYFPTMYSWLNAGGYAHVTNYLETYAIPAELNPAGACHRAPETSSTGEALSASLGGVEQEIIEAVDEGRPGFAGGWVSSVAIERLLNGIHASRKIPPNKRREMLQSLGYDWHPALKGGRVNNAIPMDDGKKSRLFIKHGHVSMNLTTPAAVSKAYQDAQQAAVNSDGLAAEVFQHKPEVN